MSEERGFEVVDKRGAAAPETGSASAPEDAGPGAAADEEPGSGGGGEGELPEFTIGATLRMMINLLNEQAWISLGLMPNPMTGQVRQNLPECRRAIDVLADLGKHLEPDATPEELREFQTLLSNLRLNYVRQSQTPSG